MAVVLILAYAGLACVSVLLAVIDLRTLRLPDRIVLPSAALFLGFLTLATLLGAPPTRLGGALLAAACLAAIYALLWLIGGVGFGDVKLAALLGLALGWLGWGAVALGTAVAFVGAGLVAIALIAMCRAERRTKLPFGPFMLLGAWVAILCAFTGILRA